MYYLIVIISVMMFGGCFALNDLYRKLRTSTMASSIENSFVGSVAGLVVLLAISGFDFQATPFTLCIALLSALCGMGFVFCSFKALDSANLSLYSLFSMLGGMALPFFQGILFYGERIYFYANGVAKVNGEDIFDENIGKKRSLAKAEKKAYAKIRKRLIKRWSKVANTLDVVGSFIDKAHDVIEHNSEYLEQWN